MKKRSKNLISLLMVFTLLGSLFCNVNTVNAQETGKIEETVVTRSESARQAIVPKSIHYGGEVIATLNCIITFTYGLPSGQPLVGTRSYSISDVKTGYAIGNVSSSVTNGNPASIIYTYNIYLDGGHKTSGQVTARVDNSGKAY